jgi:hypothetical protein
MISCITTDGLTGHACDWVIPELPIQIVLIDDFMHQTDGLTGHPCEGVIPELPIQVVLIDDFMHLDALLLLLMVCCVFRAYNTSCSYRVTNRNSVT